MIHQTLRMTLAIALFSLLATPFAANASAAGLGHKLIDQTGVCTRCPACDHSCQFSVDVVDEKKTCFEVESKVICIPRVVFPWQKGNCDAVVRNNGARTRRVCVLKTKEYKCPRCEYSWSAEKKKPCDGNHHEHRPSEPSVIEHAPTPAENVAPEATTPQSLPAPVQAARLGEDAYYSLFETLSTR
ncbi:hypothetical protein Pla52o_03270 [Novipirellula galeiformis]|uniref:Secreted protein n=1 Tax=Novipirellula galeiformis TaxID=2528004 RepID=A0A5C6CSE0_9BACT|nr:hypothetical protein [Novipirellula galeiformis]TWU26474.1 hypothetical protein Pla52o_03270 [Novipirellula galeiformis]